MDLNNNIVDFVRYVDSYPILSSGKEGFTQIKSQYEWHRKNENLITNRKTPLPTKSKKVTVVGGKTIVTEMLNEGLRHE